MRLPSPGLPLCVAVSLLLAGSPALSADSLSNNRMGYGPKGQAHPMAAGWVYRNCANVTTALSGSGFVVKITNTDSTWASATSTTAAPTAAQLMLLRACRQGGAYWGLYTTGTSWTAAVGY